MNVFLYETSLHIVKLEDLSCIHTFDQILDFQNGSVHKWLPHENVVLMKAQPKHIGDCIQAALSDPTRKQHITMAVEDLRACKRYFKQHARIVKAAGGLVLKNGHLLFIHRHGYWDLPKGKLDNGETLAQCAAREVQEECNVQVRALDRIVRTYHLLPPKRAGIHLKRTDWYQMQLIDDTNMRPQHKEGIRLVQWVPPQLWNKHMKQAYPSIGYVIKAWQKHQLA